jgi:hypothetical protein
MTLTIDSSDYTGATSKLPKILLNGNNICMVKNDFQDDRVLCTNSDSSSFLAACLRATHDPLPHFPSKMFKTSQQYYDHCYAGLTLHIISTGQLREQPFYLPE